MEFQGFTKIPRLNRECIITEKIDGTNAVIAIDEDGSFQVGSKNRWITPKQDNFGFARWAYEHEEELRTLGPGFHYGEWWGNGIQRGYGLLNGDKRFSLFNVHRWWQGGHPACVTVVPVIYSGPFSTTVVESCVEFLRSNGSKAVHGSKAVQSYMKPEGVIVYHCASRSMFKVTLDNDAQPKGLQYHQ